MSQISENKHSTTTGPRALRRGLAVLAALRDAGPAGMGVTAISKQTNIERPTVYRLLSGLIEAGWVHNSPHDKRYSAILSSVETDGSTAIGIRAATDPLLKQAVPAMRRLAAQVKDAVFMVVREGDESVAIHREIGEYPVQILATYPGMRHPLGVGSAGMALLAALPEAEAKEIVERNSVRMEQYGGLTAQTLHRLRENSRIRGYSVMRNYAVRGAIGVGCALTNGDGTPLLAISVGAIVERMPLSRQYEVADLIKNELASLKL